MKIKDLISLSILALILIVVGSFMVTKLGRSGQPRTAQVEVVLPINPVLNDEARQIILGKKQDQPATEFTAPLKLNSGLGNTTPFGR